MESENSLVYLIGMMGSGKSSTGSALAELLGQSFLDLDEYIVEQQGKSIASIFKEDGEPFFRECERQALVETSLKFHGVIGTGGGIVLNEDNVATMKNKGVVIYLEGSVEVLWERVRHSKHRPLVQGDNAYGRFEEMYKERHPLYRDATTVAVNTDGKSPKQVAIEIQEQKFYEKD